MYVGEIIYSNETNTRYNIIEVFKGGGQAEVAFARSDDNSDKYYFVKRLLNIKYFDKLEQKRFCDNFFRNKKSIYDNINVYTLPNSSCVHVLDFFKYRTFFYVVTEKIIHIGKTIKYIADYISFEDKLLLMKILAYSLWPLHKNNIIHGDLKPENILLKQVGDHLVTKLIDIEDSYYFYQPPNKGEVIGTDLYYSPEMALYNNEKNTINKSILSCKSDIFSLGIVFFEIMTGNYPSFSGKEELYAFEAVLSRSEIILNEIYSKKLRYLIQSMINIDTQKRPDVNHIIEMLNDVEISDFEKIISNKICAPLFNIDRLTDSAFLVHLFSVTNDSSIYYTTDGSVPTIKSMKYTVPILFKSDVSIKTITVKYIKDEPVYSDCVEKKIEVSLERKKKVSKPVIDICNNLIIISCSTEEAQIYFTDDESEPNNNSRLYVNPFVCNESIIIKAIAIKKGLMNSEIITKHSKSSVKIK